MNLNSVLQKPRFGIAKIHNKQSSSYQKRTQADQLGSKRSRYLSTLKQRSKQISHSQEASTVIESNAISDSKNSRTSSIKKGETDPAAAIKRPGRSENRPMNSSVFQARKRRKTKSLNLYGFPNARVNPESAKNRDPLRAFMLPDLRRGSPTVSSSLTGLSRSKSQGHQRKSRLVQHMRQINYRIEQSKRRHTQSTTRLVSYNPPKLEKDSGDKKLEKSPSQKEVRDRELLAGGNVPSFDIDALQCKLDFKISSEEKKAAPTIKRSGGQKLKLGKFKLDLLKKSYLLNRSKSKEANGVRKILQSKERQAKPSKVLAMFDKLKMIGSKKEKSSLSHRRADYLENKLRSTSSHDQSTELFSIKDPYST